ncbi:Uncharacterized protein Fot_39350 [Forsythia ovata]|uniref:Uncharacterized protein n=1 Tax=Forsythia ovata TaxID=205694 RepID=A0ABD1S6V2_9LAMI
MADSIENCESEPTHSSLPMNHVCRLPQPPLLPETTALHHPFLQSPPPPTPPPPPLPPPHPHQPSTFSYTESSPNVRPIGLRKPKYFPFKRGRLDRGWTGVCAPMIDLKID